MKPTVAIAILLMSFAFLAANGMDDIQRLYDNGTPPVYSDVLFQVTLDTLSIYKDTLRSIYENKLKSNPGLQCRLMFKFSIHFSTGHISKISLVSDNTDDSLFKSQIQQIVRQNVFTEGLPVTIDWPLMFSK